MPSDWHPRPGELAGATPQHRLIIPLKGTAAAPVYGRNGMSTKGIYLQWEGKRLYRQRIPTPRILEPVKKLSVGDVDHNLIIEGDSLQALASLKPRYAG